MRLHTVSSVSLQSVTIGMTIHSIYIFSKTGTCLYYAEWVRPRSSLSDSPEEDRKLMFGLLFSLKQLMNKMGPLALAYVTCTRLRALCSTRNVA